ncbi:acetylcholine receptor subunit beta-like 1 isoform X2 [Biomphalaria glabrata]|uniref:Acetylcholine receptor subunit beta-like 1 isoform X2 n=1 Tax=Biomphalaria glabrata TaxID=6526 RepID=A0A9W3B8Y9_BIOGL|nr:acetylcholine receptor subunit beta-like 1 isoform X2 [Biomphalaria glabrata]
MLNYMLLLFFSMNTQFLISAEMDERDINEQKLHEDLFHKNSYNSLIRPVVNTSSSLEINFSLVLSAIINVDEKNQVIITNVWLQMDWIDYQLAWDPSKYGNISKIKVDNKFVWVPDVVLFNNADGKFEPSYTPNCVIDNSGSVQFIPPAIYTSSCSIDVEYFPFDQQECEMKFGSWTFEGKTLNYSFSRGNDRMDLSDYMKNGAWDIIDVPGHKSTIGDSITGEPKSIIVFKLVIRRKTLFYTVNLIIPCFLHALVCLCVFVLPAHGSEKITLVISVLVSLVVFLLLLQKILPPSMTIPLIAKYFIFTFIMNVLEIIMTVIIIFASHRSPRTAIMPKWICWIFLYKLPKYLFMERPEHDKKWQKKNCSPPPSYPNTPQVPRANLFVRQPVPENQQRRQKPKTTATTSSDLRENERVNERVNAWRQKFKKSHSPGVTLSSSASGSHFSSDESPTIEMREFAPPNLPTNGHRCILRDPGTSQSEESLCQAKPSEISKLMAFSDPNLSPIDLTRELYSASNAIKFICRQMKNNEDYNTVLDDWKYLAAVLDRLMMIIFILVSLGGTLGVLINAPHILETVDQDKIIADIIKARN